jgi:hypothetical protein
MKIAHTACDDFAPRCPARSTPSRYEKDKIFNLAIPTSCPDVPADVLQPRKTWANGADYDDAGRQLARMFVDNFKELRRGSRPRRSVPRVARKPEKLVSWRIRELES